MSVWGEAAGLGDEAEGAAPVATAAPVETAAPAMRTENVEFYSGGTLVRGLLRTPAAGAGPYPAIVQGPGWLGLGDGANYRRYHEALCAAGFAVLIFDYRGSGSSDGSRSTLLMSAQLDDLRSAVAYLAGRPDIAAIGCFGSGGTGGGHVFELLAGEPELRCGVALLPIADGRDWLRRMRDEDEWGEFMGLLRADRIRRATTGHGAIVHPRTEIAVPTPERLTTTVKADVDGRAPSAVGLDAADELLRYRPLDAARAVTAPTLVLAVEGDDVTPYDHAVGLHAALRGPKRLVTMRDTTHYASYDRFRTETTQAIVEWFETWLKPPAGAPAQTSEVAVDE